MDKAESLLTKIAGYEAAEKLIARQKQLEAVQKASRLTDTVAETSDEAGKVIENIKDVPKGNGTVKHIAKIENGQYIRIDNTSKGPQTSNGPQTFKGSLSPEEQAANLKAAKGGVQPVINKPELETAKLEEPNLAQANIKTNPTKPKVKESVPSENKSIPEQLKEKKDSYKEQFLSWAKQHPLQATGAGVGTGLAAGFVGHQMFGGNNNDQ